MVGKTVAATKEEPVKRGRRPTGDLKYERESKARIDGWKDELKKPNLSTKEKNTLKNRISALESRLKKRAETKNLNSIDQNNAGNFGSIVKTIETALD